MEVKEDERKREAWQEGKLERRKEEKKEKKRKEW